MNKIIRRRKQASRNEKLTMVLGFEISKYKDLPFEEARRVIISKMRVIVRYCPVTIYRSVKEDYPIILIHEKYLPKNFITRTIVPRIPRFENELKDYHSKQIKKEFKILITELKKSNRMVEVHIVETIIIPNVIDGIYKQHMFGSDIRDYLTETILNARILDNNHI